ncbi:MAG: hypothetical protein ACQERF_03455 [Actinomycetota bacterium]
MTSDWSQKRREAADEHAERLRRRQAAQSSRAQAMLDEFTAAALRTGVETTNLQVSGGRRRASSNIEGWYVRNDHSMGVGTDGRLYVLTMPLSLLDVLRGVELTPMIEPPLVIGAGGRDGDSIDLADALDRVLPGWRDAQDPDAQDPDVQDPDVQDPDV